MGICATGPIRTADAWGTGSAGPVDQQHLWHCAGQTISSHHFSEGFPPCCGGCLGILTWKAQLSGCWETCFRPPSPLCFRDLPVLHPLCREVPFTPKSSSVVLVHFLRKLPFCDVCPSAGAAWMGIRCPWGSVSASGASWEPQTSPGASALVLLSPSQEAPCLFGNSASVHVGVGSTYFLSRGLSWLQNSTFPWTRDLTASHLPQLPSHLCSHPPHRNLLPFLNSSFPPK